LKIRYLLDTHAFVWAAHNPDKLGLKARRVIETAGPDELGISATTVIELGQLIHDDEVNVDGRPSEIFAAALASITQVPVSLDAAIAAPRLALPHADPADRIIVATALNLGVPLITKDGNITDSGIVRVIWWPSSTSINNPIWAGCLIAWMPRFIAHLRDNLISAASTSGLCGNRQKLPASIMKSIMFVVQLNPE
jgi:PIN domain nuclease of toxin-antitoxin system